MSARRCWAGRRSRPTRASKRSSRRRTGSSRPGCDEERESLLERWGEEVGQASGRAAGSWEDAIGAAADGRIESALVDGRNVAAWVCPTCDRGSVEGGECPFDGTPLVDEPGGALELVVRGTLVNGGDVRFTGDSKLDGTQGVAALYRYAIRPVDAT